VRARKRFGQHFLERAWVEKVVDAIAPEGSDVFLEVGPGPGALTRPLAARAARVIAVEIDRDLAAALPSRVPDNVSVVTGDILAVDLAELLRPFVTLRADAASRGIRVAGNLPYNISSPILFKLLHFQDTSAGLRDATIMLQREVADRLAARPGTKDYGVLALSAGLRADVTRLLTLPPGAFRPAPQVTSAVVRLSFRPPPVGVNRTVFDRLVRGLFLHRRKTLANALRGCWPVTASLGPDEALSRAELDGRRRPETLDLVEMARLAAAWPASAP
jgi:16S rRNA (adenine1518-N6/adenine1519-N6)-dimethyltransferase